MAELVTPGSAGLGQFTLDTATGAVRFDPQSAAGWPAGVTETRATVAVRDAAGAYAFAQVAVDVTRAAAAASVVVADLVDPLFGSGTSHSFNFGPAQAGDFRLVMYIRSSSGTQNVAAPFSIVSDLNYTLSTAARGTIAGMAVSVQDDGATFTVTSNLSATGRAIGLTLRSLSGAAVSVAGVGALNEGSSGNATALAPPAASPGALFIYMFNVRGGISAVGDGEPEAPSLPASLGYWFAPVAATLSGALLVSDVAPSVDKVASTSGSVVWVARSIGVSVA